MIIYTPGIYEKQQRLRPIKCPKCKHGRICDVSYESKTRMTQSVQSITNNFDNEIFIKCPKCGASIAFSLQPIYLHNEIII